MYTIGLAGTSVKGLQRSRASRTRVILYVYINKQTDLICLFTEIGLCNCGVGKTTLKGRGEVWKLWELMLQP